MQKRKVLPVVSILLTIVLIFGVFAVQAEGAKKPKKRIVKSYVRLIIATGRKTLNYRVPIKKKYTVYTVLRTASKKHRFSLNAKRYSFGVFVEKIAGVKNNPQAGRYWLYYVNKKLANVGASLRKVKKGDRIKWVYSKTD
ncbi:MAG: DUF4430 domain-containing protein [Actinobacteria bacterium]|nr:MAG: DUF4430 domain-containing protein [Actinomycetota bacterium]